MHYLVDTAKSLAAAPSRSYKHRERFFAQFRKDFNHAAKPPFAG
jgi:hypothetical protein